MGGNGCGSWRDTKDTANPVTCPKKQSRRKKCHGHRVVDCQSRGVQQNLPENGSARLVANGAFGRDGEIALHPLVRHGDIAFVIFDDVLADAGQRRPLAVVDGFDGAPLVRLELADFAAEPVRRHTFYREGKRSRRQTTASPTIHH